jgi:hypothetical protein
MHAKKETNLIMWQFCIFFVLNLICIVVSAKTESQIQVDMLIFSHNTQEKEHSYTHLKPAADAIAISSQITKASTNFHLLPSTSSQLKNEFWVLNRKPLYTVLANYSWIQPKNIKKSVKIPEIYNKGWEGKGTMSLIAGNYYRLSTNLQFVPPNQLPLHFEQEQHIKEGKVYYLDHPQVGILIKIHQVG